MHKGEVFSYRRGKGQGEARLHSKRSVGIGGHISSIDQHAPSVYREGMRREIEEELILESKFQEKCIGLINDDLTEVGKVHLGIVHLFEIDDPKVRAREESIHDAGFAKPSELILQRDQFETWSQICLDHLFS
jgi:predicted NUDIX family phosphoesterase